DGVAFVHRIEQRVVFRLRFAQGFFGAFALGDVADVGLDDRTTIFLVEVGDHFNFKSLARFGLKRQVFVADETFLPPPSDRGLALLLVSQQAYFKYLLADQLLARVTEQLSNEGIGVGDPARVAVENQYPIPGGFKEPPVTMLALAQRLIGRRRELAQVSHYA